MQQLTVKQYADKKGIGKRYIQHLLKSFEQKKHLLPDVEKVELRTDIHGTKYYVLFVR